MPIFDLYSQGQEPATASFKYDQFQKELKIPCEQTWTEFFIKALLAGQRKPYYQLIAKVLMKEHALEYLPSVLH